MRSAGRIFFSRNGWANSGWARRGREEVSSEEVTDRGGLERLSQPRENQTLHSV